MDFQQKNVKLSILTQPTSWFTKEFLQLLILNLKEGFLFVFEKS
jgi:hypothetical protein